ncbi:MAG: DNA adenine methylase [Chloroflexi bacterium]|nr:DNA adenine methylase [Chloroflexota bacterium]
MASTVVVSPSRKSQAAEPFLKWAGGKRQLLDVYESRFPTSYEQYFEPFLGSGAVFFRLAPCRAILSDIVEEVVQTYLAVRDEVEKLITSLEQHVNEEAYFYRVRSLDPRSLSAVEQASRFIYLNRTCYNGLFRVNREGQFNVPFGFYKNPKICDPERLRTASVALRHATIRCGDFDAVLKDALPGDFVYLDPPYSPLSATASFTAYSKQGFGKSDQERLAAVFRRLDARGCLLMLSNSDTDMVHRLYASFRVIRVEARRAINSKGDRRGPVSELLVLNYNRSVQPRHTQQRPQDRHAMLDR